MIRLRTETNKSICCFVARTPQERENGLNDWGKLPQGVGLLFSFGNVQEYASFHMDRVWYPIDIIFLDSEARVIDMYNGVPGSNELYTAENVKWVLELSHGHARGAGIGVGTRLFAYDELFEFNNKLQPMTLAAHAAWNAHLSGNPCYGAVLCVGSSVVGWGHNTTVSDNCPTRHAEMNAIHDALARGYTLDNAKMYTTHTPCIMCQGACAWSKVRETEWLIPSPHSTMHGIHQATGMTPTMSMYRGPSGIII